MVTYKNITEVVRNRFVNHQAKRVDSRAILLQIETSVGALVIVKAQSKLELRLSKI